MILIHDIRLPLSAGEPQDYEKALHLARIPRSRVSHLGIAKLSVDARHGQPKLVYTVAVTLKEEREEAACAGASRSVTVRGKTDLSVQNGTLPLTHRPVVCGLGPAGLFAALLLARQGYRPIVLERGPALEERVKAVEHFSATGELDENANIQFGEGGAGTFSDGKLTTRIGDELCGFVTEVFLEHGAPKEIACSRSPMSPPTCCGASSLRSEKRSSRWAAKSTSTQPSPASSGGMASSSASRPRTVRSPVRRWCSRWATRPATPSGC